MCAMRYARYLSPSYQELLVPSGPLHFLVSDFRGWITDDPNALDLQLREGDKLTYYHGTTKLLTAAYQQPSGCIAFSAAPAYGAVVGSENLMRPWTLAESEQLRTAVPAYLQAAVKAAHERDYRNRGEGFWQNRLALAFGPDWRPGM